MSEAVSDRRKATFQKHRQTLVIGLLRFRSQGIEGENRPIHREDRVNQRGSVGLDAGKITNPLCQALRSLEDGVEKVFLEQFRPAVFEDLRVNASPL